MAAAAGYRLEAYETLGSTNAEAFVQALGPLGTRPLWITAQRQTAGRGRRGSSWMSPPGNLHATLLLQDPAPPQVAPQLSFVAALAVCDAILDCAPVLDDKVAFKWPNDILCAGAKLAGILIEGREIGRLATAIGIGVNCVQHPADTAYPATDLAEAGAAVTAEELFFALSGAMLRRLSQWRCGDGFAAVRRDWLARAAGVGSTIQVRLPSRALTGRWEALDPSGCLLLRLGDGTLETVAAGEVFPLAAGAPAQSFLDR
ncbi:MAG: biotin--[acetyl-CoA-carboxylase] ligase [Xanthobacteraceae bacterium]